MGLFRPKGISLLVPTQNAEQTIELCLRSFKDFPDEMIVVDNGSTDSTIEIIKSLQGEIPNMKFFEAPQLKDLYENRQFAFERSKYSWIMRIDSDYVAYTSGPNSISKLRDKVLNTRGFIRPVAYEVTQINVFGTIEYTGKEDFYSSGRNRYVSPPTNRLRARIIQWYPGMKFMRMGRWEGIRWQQKKVMRINFFDHRVISEPYWMHCTFKSNKALFYRSERTNWRECGDFTTYPTLDKWILKIIQDKYKTDNIEDAIDLFIKDQVAPAITKYNTKEHYPYPELLEKAHRDNKIPYEYDWKMDS